MTEVNLQDLDREALVEHQLAGYQKLPDLVRLWPHVFGELATGKPVDPARVAALAGLPLDRTIAVLRYGEWDPAGERLVGFGLTSIETPHHVDMGEVTMWAWCAPDALFIPSMIGKAARIESPCAATGEPIHIRTTPAGVERVEPASAVVSTVSSDLLVTQGRQVCNASNLYRDAEAASDWLAANPNGMVLPVVDTYDLYREVDRRLQPWLAQQTDRGLAGHR
ncbi:MAG: organomercurial lyase [Solirubrobacteraceae bacterium]